MTPSGRRVHPALDAVFAAVVLMADAFVALPAALMRGVRAMGRGAPPATVPAPADRVPFRWFAFGTAAVAVTGRAPRSHGRHAAAWTRFAAAGLLAALTAVTALATL
ncbi:hypothetical protein [Streptomyces hydrogenans]|uniref:hypothetical protein n=1 Tax=Streptomyces hydrogenans TaxID=1873719 RepID=UPI0035E1D5E4